MLIVVVLHHTAQGSVYWSSNVRKVPPVVVIFTAVGRIKEVFASAFCTASLLKTATWNASRVVTPIAVTSA
jgi:hypothetical protein